MVAAMSHLWHKRLKVYKYFWPDRVYEPFGLGRFAKDHSLTKGNFATFVIRVRHYAPQTTTPTRPCLSVIKNYRLAVNIRMPIRLNIYDLSPNTVFIRIVA